MAGDYLIAVDYAMAGDYLMLRDFAKAEDYLTAGDKTMAGFIFWQEIMP